jgi:hypothetical protein
MFTECNQYKEQIKILSARYYVIFWKNKFQNSPIYLINIYPLKMKINLTYI